MIFKFEELQITINGRKFLVDGELSLEDDKWHENELLCYPERITYLFDVETEAAIPLCVIDSRLIENAVNREFYKADSTLYNDALAFWEDRK